MTIETPSYFRSEMRRADLAWTDWPAIEMFLKNELDLQGCGA